MTDNPKLKAWLLLSALLVIISVVMLIMHELPYFAQYKLLVANLNFFVLLAVIIIAKFVISKNYPEIAEKYTNKYVFVFLLIHLIMPHLGTLLNGS